MIEDPIVNEVRLARDEYAKKFDYDLDAICRDLQWKQNLSHRQVVSLSPKRSRRRLKDSTQTAT